MLATIDEKTRRPVCKLIAVSVKFEKLFSWIKDHSSCTTVNARHVDVVEAAVFSKLHY